jgi:hypothetical protein
MLGSSRVAAQLMALQEGLSSVSKYILTDYQSNFKVFHHVAHCVSSADCRNLIIIPHAFF